MNVKCPHCGTEYEVEKKDMYHYTKCEVCGKGFVVGAETSLQAEPSAARPSGGNQMMARGAKTQPQGSAVPRSRPFANINKPTASPNSQQRKSRITNAARTDAAAPDKSDIPPESACLKAWAKYWLARILIILGVSFALGFVGGFVGSLTGCAPFVDWPKEGAQRLAHYVVYLVFIFGVCMVWRLSWWGYKRYAVRNLLPEQSASNMLSSWLVPILVNMALSLLMPMGPQIAVLGVYGCIVWGITIWIAVDYFMFRFISVNLLFGRKIDSRWICPTILFCMFIVVMYGFARIAENDGVRHNDASQIYDRMKQMDDSRHHDASQIYDRMGRMKLY